MSTDGIRVPVGENYVPQERPNGKAAHTQADAQPAPTPSGFSAIDGHDAIPGAATPATPINPAPKTSLATKLKQKRAKAAVEGKHGGRGERHQTSIPVRTPDKQWWFRCHRDPGMQVPVDLLVVKSGADEGIYFLDPEVDFPDELDQYIVPALLTRAITHDGTEFFFLAKQSEKSPKQSTRRCVNEARNAWIQMRWNPTTKAYDFSYARQLRREPTWSDKTLDELLEMAFGDAYITRADHEVVNRLLYPDDEDFAGNGDVD